MKRLLTKDKLHLSIPSILPREEGKALKTKVSEAVNPGVLFSDINPSRMHYYQK